jgi:hypothetical protein
MNTENVEKKGIHNRRGVINKWVNSDLRNFRVTKKYQEGALMRVGNCPYTVPTGYL